MDKDEKPMMVCFLVGLLLYMVSQFLQLLLGHPFSLVANSSQTPFDK